MAEKQIYVIVHEACAAARHPEADMVRMELDRIKREEKWFSCPDQKYIPRGLPDPSEDITVSVCGRIIAMGLRHGAEIPQFAS